MANSRAVQESDTVVSFVGTPEALHAAVNGVYRNAKERVAAAGPEKKDPETGEVTPRAWRLIFGPDHDDRSQKQNRFYWGYVLRAIAEQASVQGQRYASDAWHELFKRQFLGYEVIKAPVAGRRRPTVYRRLRSTTGLTVPQMSKYLEQVLAFASTDLTVAFHTRDWREYRG